MLGITGMALYYGRPYISIFSSLGPLGFYEKYSLLMKLDHDEVLILVTSRAKI
jgi:hypothetical protein